jgi:hypothetical protein
VIRDGVHHLAKHLRRPVTSSQRGSDDCLQTFTSELLTGRRASLGDPIGVEQHDITVGQVQHRLVRGDSPETERKTGPALDLGRTGTLAEQERARMTGVDDPQATARERQGGQLSGDEPRVPEDVGDHVIDVGDQFAQRVAAPATTSVLADGQVRHPRSLQPVTHRVEHRHGQLVTGDRVVERVTSDVVGRLEHT